jgi:hypothetical protein
MVEELVASIGSLTQIKTVAIANFIPGEFSS